MEGVLAWGNGDTVHAVLVDAGSIDGRHKRLSVTERQRLGPHLASGKENVPVEGGGVAEAGRPS